MKQLNRIADAASKTTTVTMAGLKWNCNYGVYSTCVAGWVDIALAYESSGYKMRIAGKTLKARGKDANDAAAIAVAAAKDWGAKLMAALGMQADA